IVEKIDCPPQSCRARRGECFLDHEVTFEQFDPDVREESEFLQPVKLLHQEPIEPQPISLRFRHPSLAQCPTYFAYSVRPRSTSFVPLMIPRPPGNPVNSYPSPSNFSRKRLKLTFPIAPRWRAISSKFNRDGVRCVTCTALRPHRLVVCEPCSPSSHSNLR